MIVIILNANSGYDIAALNAKEICLFRKLIIMHIDQEAYIYIYIYDIWMTETPEFLFQFFYSSINFIKIKHIHVFFFFFKYIIGT